MSNAPGATMPSLVATLAAVLGIWTSPVQVATITRSMSAADSPLAASALPPAATAMSATVSSGPAIRRLTIPTRLRIHSSVVSTLAVRSSLVTTLAGWYPPNARMRAPGDPSVSRISGSPFCSRRFLRLQPDQGLAGVDGVAVLDQPFDDRAREGRRDRVLAGAHLDVAEGVACVDADPGRHRVCPVAAAEGPGERGNEQPPLRDMAILVLVRRAELGQQRPGSC